MWNEACDVINLSLPQKQIVEVIIRVQAPSCACGYSDYCRRGGCIENCQKSKSFKKHVEEAREKRDRIAKIGINSQIQFI